MSIEVSKYLTCADPVLGQFIKKFEPDTLVPNNRITLFEALVKSVIGQQLSGKAAHSILSKLKVQVGGKKPISPEKILSTPYGKIRSAGVSDSKTRTIVTLAGMVKTGAIPSSRKMRSMSDEEVVQSLTAVKGIGQWTAEMFLMFNLNRPNIFPVKDIGLLRAISKNYKTTYPPSKRFLKKISKIHYGYRTVFTWYMWRSIDPVDVEY